MTKQIRDSVSFGVMATLVFILASFFGSEIFETEDAVDSYWYLHWIDLHRHFDIHKNSGVYSVERIHISFLVALIAISVGLTWVLSKALRKFLRRKE